MNHDDSDIRMQYNVSVTGVGGNDKLPATASFNLDEEQTREILRLSALTMMGGAIRIEKASYICSYLHYTPEQLAKLKPEEVQLDSKYGNEVACENPTLSVSKEDFWFSANYRDGGPAFMTKRMPIKDLAEYFGLIYPPTLTTLFW